MTTKFLFYQVDKKEFELNVGDSCPDCGMGVMVTFRDDLMACDRCSHVYYSFTYEQIINKVIPVSAGDMCPRCETNKLVERVGSLCCARCGMAITQASAVTYGTINPGQVYQIVGEKLPGELYVKPPDPRLETFLSAPKLEDDDWIVLVDPWRYGVH